MIKDISNNRFHWEKTYKTYKVEDLGWYEDSPEQSLVLIEKCNLDKNDVILHVGAGATTLIDELLELGYLDMIGSDISETSLFKLRNRLGKESSQVEWIIDDLTKSTKLINLSGVDLWHDRAVLHFFTEEKDQDAYFDLLFQLVKPGGFVIISVFNLEGAIKCSGLPVLRYNKQMLADRLGKNFECVHSFDHLHHCPGGDVRPYIYILFKRVK